MDAAAALSARFVALLGGVHHDEPGGLLGVEQEFTVRTGSQWPADFRELLPELPISGDPLDPGDPSARRVASGVVITADGREAEAVTPPVAVQPGFARDVAAWARAARHELESRLPDAYALSGYSTHLSVSIDDARNPRVGALYARTFASGLMLLVDRATSPGLIIRPRPGRVELCGEFVDGPWLRAAAVFSVGSVLACRDAVRGTRSLSSLPPQLQVAVRPASARAGWFVDRAAFGTDLLAHGRQARLRRCDSRRIRAQEHLEWAWSVARDALVSRAGAEDIAAVDDIVSGELPLPSHASPGLIDTGEPGELPAASPLGAVDHVRIRAGFTVHALASTWKHTVFCVRSRVRHREAYTSIPRAHLARFFEQLEAGALDGVIGEYLALDAAERPLAMTGSEPALGDVAPSADSVTERELDRQLSDTVPSQWARERKDVVEIPGVRETVTQRPGCLPGTKWLLVGGVVVALVIGGIVVALTGGGGGEKQSSTPVISESECGKDATGATIDWTVIQQKCDYRVTSGLTYKFDPKPFETATIDVGTTGFKPYIGGYCKIHDATPTELDNGRDPLTNFRGLSLFGVPIAGLQPNGLLQIGVQAPDGAVRTGNGIADAAGYAEARIPINVPQNHTILTANYYPGGNASGPAISIPPTDIARNGVLDGSFPGTRCNRDATLALVPKQTTPSAASKQAKAAFTSSASLFPLLVSLANPGADIDLSGPWTVAEEGSYYAAQGSGVSFDLVPGTNTGRDKPGDAPAFVAYYAGTVVYPTSAGTGDAWGEAFPCGPGQLALTICPRQGARFRGTMLVKVGAVFDRPVPLQPKTDVRYSFAVGPSTIDLTYRGKKWSLLGSDNARALIRNNVVVVLLPASEAGDGAYRVSTSVGSKHDTQPPANLPAVSVQTTNAAAGVPGMETAQQFVTALSRALAATDATFLTSRMHPAVIERYGTAECQVFAASPHAEPGLTAKEVHAPAIYRWETDGLSRDIPETNEVVASRADGSSPTIHLALVDGLWRWFTDCGTLLPNAR